MPGNPWWERDGSQQQFRFRTTGTVGGGVEELEADDTDQDDAAGEEKKFQQLLKGSWQHLSDEAKDAYRLRMQKLRDRIVIQYQTHKYSLLFRNLIFFFFLLLLLARSRDPSWPTAFGRSTRSLV